MFSFVDGSDRPLLPDVSEENIERHDVACPNRNPECFLAGDFRINEQSSLTVMHTLWVREHNRIAAAIKQSNPSFDADQVFFTTRQIVAADIAKITYQDYLPILLGAHFASLVGDYRGYDPTVMPVVPNAFATAAYRFGHSQIQPFFERLDENLQSISAGPLSLQDAFFDTSHVREFGTDAILRGLLAKQARRVDEFLNSILTNTLFADSMDIPGLDLASLNIQRGRDHGLPKYLTWKQWAERRCHITSEFRSSLTEIRLIQTYGSLENVDLFVGGLAEKPLSNGLVGAVFSCIFAKTFSAVRNGDRFYYENSGETGVFSQEQREQIGKASLSRVICDNTDIMQVQPNAFMADQTRVPCSKIPSIDLSAWAPKTILPRLCYVKVASNRFLRKPFAASVRIGERGIHCHQAPIRAGGSRCFPILCPRLSGVAAFLVRPKAMGCAVSPRSLVNPGFIKVVTSSFASTRNGLYTSLGSCQAGKNVGVKFTCGGDVEASIMQTEEPDSIDFDTDSDDRIREFTGSDEVVDLLDDAGRPAAASATLKEDEGKLVMLMEEVLEELKTNAADSKASYYTPGKAEEAMPTSDTLGEAEAASPMKDADGYLLSELDEILKELE